MNPGELTKLQVIQGIFTTIFVVLSIIIGLKIIFSSGEENRKENITLGATWILLGSAWWGSSFRYVIIIIFSFDIGNFAHLFLSNVFIPIAPILWIYTITSTVYAKHKKSAMLFICSICTPYEIMLIIFLLFKPDLVGTTESVVDLIYTIFPQSFLIFAIIISICTGLIFSRRSMNIPDPRIQWRGRLFFLAFLLFGIGSLFDVILLPNPSYLIFVRLLLIFSSIAYYLAFFLPEWLVKRLIKP
ncbi:MAG: hypothetical protein ACOC44_09370 [Promethearchaeia archaeon]